MNERLPLTCVIGGGRGIGRAVALNMAATHEVHIADRDGAAAEAVARELRTTGSAGQSHTVDLGTPDTIDSLFDTLDELSRPVSSVVLTAALFPRMSVEQTTSERAHEVLAVNVLGPIAVILRGRRSMSDGGSFVCLTSRAARHDVADTAFQRPFALYGASKSALERWVLGVAHELLDQGLRIHLVTPGGLVRTPGVEALGLTDVSLTRSIGVDDVADPIAALARTDRPDLVGVVLDALEHGSMWTA